MTCFFKERAADMVQWIKIPALPDNLSPILEVMWLKERVCCPLTSMYMTVHTEAKLETNDMCKTVFLTLLFFEK